MRKRSSPKPGQAASIRRKPSYFQQTALIVNCGRAQRELLERYFSAADYHVLTSRTTGEALELCRSYEGAIHILIADGTVSGAASWKLAESAARIRPGLVVLFVSPETLSLRDFVPRRAAGCASENASTEQALATLTHALISKKEFRYHN